MKTEINFKEILKTRNVSFNELSKRSGISVRTIEEWYYNDKEPGFYKAEKVLAAMGYKLKIDKGDDARHDNERIR